MKVNINDIKSNPEQLADLLALNTACQISQEQTSKYPSVFHLLIRQSRIQLYLLVALLILVVFLIYSQVCFDSLSTSLKFEESQQYLLSQSFESLDCLKCHLFPYV